MRRRGAAASSPAGTEAREASADLQEQLGPLIREHRLRWPVTLSVVAATLLLGAAGVALAVRLGQHVARGAAAETLVLDALAAVTFLAAAVAVFVWGYPRIRRVFALHRGGVRVRDGERERVLPWQDIDAVYQKIVRLYRGGQEVAVRDEYKLSLRDGTVLQVDYRFEQVEALGSAVMTAVTELRAPPARRAFEEGQTLDFGPILLHREGIETGGKRLGWQEIESVSWKAGLLASDKAFLMVRRRGGLLAWAKVPVEEIKNYQVLMVIVADLGKAE